MELSISIITYNREACIKQLLDVLSKSILKNHRIILLDNCSADNTVAIAGQFQSQLPKLKIISNPVNIGGDANILRAIEVSEGDYTWVLCDDDVIDLTGFEDVIDILNKGEADLVHVGAHPDANWAKFAGQTDTPRNLLHQGYPYFKFASFVPCNIFKTKAFKDEFMIAGYRNIVYSYAHMPFFINWLENDKQIYISPKQIVTATLGSSNYSLNNFFYWWIGTSKLLKNAAETRLFFLDQWRNIGVVDDRSGLDILINLLKQGSDKPLVREYINKYFTPKDKAYIFKKTFMNGAYYTILRKMRTVKQKLVG